MLFADNIAIFLRGDMPFVLQRHAIGPKNVWKKRGIKKNRKLCVAAACCEVFSTHKQKFWYAEVKR
jgi:hypothetical protein